MATINLGRIKPVWQGAWDSGTSYIADDIVYYNNSAWIAQTTNTNSAPASNNANWELMALGTDIPSQTGNSGKALVTNGSSLSWGSLNDASALTTGTLDSGRLASGTIVGVASATYTGNASNTSETYSGGLLQVSYTPKFANSSYYFVANCYFGYSNHDVAADIAFDISGSAPGGVITPVGASGGGHQVFALSGIGSTASESTVDDWTVATTTAQYHWTPGSNLGTGTRTFQVVYRRRGSAGGVVWNTTYNNNNTDPRNFRPVSTFTMFEIKA
jgi:hypothetical protein